MQLQPSVGTCMQCSCFKATTEALIALYRLQTKQVLVIKYVTCFHLKVGSCPTDDIFFSKYFFILFNVVFKYFYFLNLFLPRKPQDFAKNSRFFVC